MLFSELTNLTSHEINSYFLKRKWTFDVFVHFTYTLASHHCLNVKMSPLICPGYKEWDWKTNQVISWPGIFLALPSLNFTEADAWLVWTAGLMVYNIEISYLNDNTDVVWCPSQNIWDITQPKGKIEGIFYSCTSPQCSVLYQRPCSRQKPTISGHISRVPSRLPQFTVLIFSYLPASLKDMINSWVACAPTTGRIWTWGSEYIA